MKLEEAIKNNYVKLNIGSGIGANVKPDYVNIDCVDNPKIDLITDVRNMPIEDNTADEAICEHVIEHLPMADALPFLKEVHRVLKPGAKFYLSCPNIIVCMQNFLEDKEHRWSEWSKHIFGGQLYESDTHRSGFNPEKLKQQIEIAGFKNIEIKPLGEYGRGIGVWCIK